MIATVTHTKTDTPNVSAETIQVVTPTALRCACDEYRVNRFCAHMVYYTAAKILAFAEQHDAQNKRGLPMP